MKKSKEIHTQTFKLLKYIDAVPNQNSHCEEIKSMREGNMDYDGDWKDDTQSPEAIKNSLKIEEGEGQKLDTKYVKNE